MQKGGSKQKKGKKENTAKQRITKREKKNCIDYQRKQLLCQLWAFNIREGESFYYTKVNLVLYTHALQIILFGPIYVRTQYRSGLLQIVSLQLASSMGRACVNLKDFRCNVSDGGSGSTSPRDGTALGGCQPAPGGVKGLSTRWSSKES